MRSHSVLPRQYSSFWLLTSCFFLLSSSSPAMQSQDVRIGSVRFQGNRAFDSAQLQRKMPAGREGAPFDAVIFQGELKWLEDLYHEEGYFQARVGPPIFSIQPSGEAKSVSIVVPITEGQIYTTGEIRITGTRVFQASTLLQMCPLNQGQPYKRKKLNDWIGKLEESYREMGYIRFELSSREAADDTRKVVNLTLDCREGEAYSVAKIAVEGNPSINPSEFKKRLLLAEGGLFNPNMISISLFYINQMRIYGSISESDVEISIDDTHHVVDLTFRLHPDRPST